MGGRGALAQESAGRTEGQAVNAPSDAPAADRSATRNTALFPVPVSRRRAGGEFSIRLANVRPARFGNGRGGLRGAGKSRILPIMDYRNIITIEPDKRFGKPCVRGMRITVYDVLSYLASGMTQEEILDNYPDLTREDILACLSYAADREGGTRIAL